MDLVKSHAFGNDFLSPRNRWHFGRRELARQVCDRHRVSVLMD
jgi:hypothetical protein